MTDAMAQAVEDVEPSQTDEMAEGGGDAATKTASETAATDEAPPPKSNASAQPASPGEVVNQVLGLMLLSPAHKHLFIADLEWLVLPPVMARQFRLFRKDGRVIAYASWALLTEEAETRFSDGGTRGVRRLAPADWTAGDRLWLVDVIAPFGGADGVIKELREKVFAGRKIKTLQPAPDGSGPAVVEW